MISHAPPTYQCPFCLLLKGIKNELVYTTQNEIVLSNERVTAFIASHQYQGSVPNVLVIPNEHFENIYTLPADYGADLQKAIKKVALALKAVYNCDGVSTRQHNEPAGSQDVWHYHTHVTARFNNDRFYHDFAINKRLMPLEQRVELAQRLKNYFASQP